VPSLVSSKVYDADISVVFGFYARDDPLYPKFLARLIPVKQKLRFSIDIHS